MFWFSLEGTAEPLWTLSLIQTVKTGNHITIMAVLAPVTERPLLMLDLVLTITPVCAAIRYQLIYSSEAEPCQQIKHSRSFEVQSSQFVLERQKNYIAASLISSVVNFCSVQKLIEGRDFLLRKKSI